MAGVVDVLGAGNPTVELNPCEAGERHRQIRRAETVPCLLYVSKNVKVNRAFKKGELDETAVQSILDDLPKILTKFWLTGFAMRPSGWKMRAACPRS